MSEGRNVLYKCRLQGRLFCLLLCVLAGLVSQAQSPATTTISDTVYRADGTPAAGTLLISWPTFSTASGQAVASGTKSVTLGTGGSLSVALVPNAGAAPANTFYTVVYQLIDGTVKTEFWSVGTTSPTTVGSTDHARFRKFGGASGDEAVCRRGCRKQGNRLGGGPSQPR